MSDEKVKLKEIDWEKYGHLLHREWCKGFTLKIMICLMFLSEYVII